MGCWRCQAGMHISWKEDFAWLIRNGHQVSREIVLLGSEATVRGEERSERSEASTSPEDNQ